MFQLMWARVKVDQKKEVFVYHVRAGWHCQQNLRKAPGMICGSAINISEKLGAMN